MDYVKYKRDVRKFEANWIKSYTMIWKGYCAGDIPHHVEEILYFGTRKDNHNIANKDKNRYPGIKCWPLRIGFTIISIGSLIFEIVENEDVIIEKYRENHGTSREYNGDSYQNIFGDIIMVQIGYMISWLFLYLNISWMSAVWFVVVDVCLILYMRDDGIFLFFNIFFKNKQIIEWQAEGVMMAKYQQMNNISLLYPPSVFL